MAELTAREREIALLAAEGHSNREIAERLFLSHHTVRCTLYNAMQKIPETAKRHRRTRLALWLFRQEQKGDDAA